MADDQYLLEDLEDEGEEVDYDDFNLEDEDLEEPAEEPAAGDENVTAGAKDGQDLNFDEPPPDFDDEAVQGAVGGSTGDFTQPAKEAEAASPEPEQAHSTETAKDANEQQSTAGRRAPIPAPTTGKGQEGSTAAAKPKETAARGGAAPQRGRQGPRGGRGQQGRGPQGRGPQGRGPQNGRQTAQPHSRGPTPPPMPNGMGMPRPGPGMPGLPMPPGMLLPGQMMAARPLQMMPRPMPMAGGQPRPPPGPGPAPPLQSPDRQRGGMHVPIPAPQPPPPREPVRWQDPMGGRGQPQMGGDGGQRRIQGGPAGLPMPPNMAHLMFPGQRLPHPQPPPPGGRQDQRSPGTSQPMANGGAARPVRGAAGDFNLALGMDASAHVRMPARGGAPGAKPDGRGVPQRLQGRLEDAAPLLGLLRPRDMAEELRQKEERQEAERARARAKEAEEKKRAKELKAKKLEMARLRIELQKAENRRNQQLLAAEIAEQERARKQRELDDFEAMKQRVLQLEKMVAAAAAAGTVPVSAPAAVPKAATAAPSVAAAAPAALVQPRKEAEAAHGDPGLQVDFDEDEEEEEEPAQAAPQQPARPNIASRLQRPSAPKDAKPTTAPHSRGVRSQVRMDQVDRPVKDKRRPLRSTPEEMDADEAPAGRAGEGFTDLREFLSRKKRSRTEGDADDSRPRAHARAAALR